MNRQPELLLSGFSDECSVSKNIDEQFSTFAALGLNYVTLRFLDVGTGVKNVMQLDDAEVALVCQKLADYDLTVSSLGSPIGKVKLLDVDDGTSNVFIPFDEYLETQVNRAIELSLALGTKLIRGFSFYHPKGTAAEQHLAAAIPRLQAIACHCDSAGLTFGLEVEANLIGHTGEMMARLFEEVDHPAMLLIFDGGNLVTQGFSRQQIFDDWIRMKPGVGWIHVKDYQGNRSTNHSPEGTSRAGEWIDENALNCFVPADIGESGYTEIMADLQRDAESMQSRLAARGIAGIFADMEPHVRGGGQFGGFSGADGMGVALRAFCGILDSIDFPYSLRDFNNIRR